MQAFKLGSRFCVILDASIRAVTLGGPLTTLDGRDLGPDQRSSARVRGAVVDDRCGGSLSKWTCGKDLGMILRKWRKVHLGEGWMSGLGKAGRRSGTGDTSGVRVLNWTTPVKRVAARFTSKISNYACRKLGFEEDNAEIALYAKLHVCYTGSGPGQVGREGPSFNGMEFEAGGLQHGLGREGRHAWLVDAVHRTELHWEAREDRRFGGLEEGEIDPEGRKRVVTDL